MTDPLDDLDHHLEALGLVADALNQHVASAPVPRTLVIAWLSEQTPSPAAASAWVDALPELPSSLAASYRAWLGGGY